MPKLLLIARSENNRNARFNRSERNCQCQIFASRLFTGESLKFYLALDLALWVLQMSMQKIKSTWYCVNCRCILNSGKYKIFFTLQYVLLKSSNFQDSTQISNRFLEHWLVNFFESTNQHSGKGLENWAES